MHFHQYIYRFIGLIMFKRCTAFSFFALAFIVFSANVSATLVLDDPNGFGNISYASGDATPTTIGP